MTGVSGEARELRGDHPFKVLGYFRRRGAGCLGHLANSPISEPSLENFSEMTESTFLPWLQVFSQLHRLGVARGHGSWGVLRGEKQPRAEPCWLYCPGPGPGLGRPTESFPILYSFPTPEPRTQVRPVKALPCRASDPWLPALPPGLRWPLGSLCGPRAPPARPGPSPLPLGTSFLHPVGGLWGPHPTRHSLSPVAPMQGGRVAASLLERAPAIHHSGAPARPGPAREYKKIKNNECEVK